MIKPELADEIACCHLTAFTDTKDVHTKNENTIDDNGIRTIGGYHAQLMTRALELCNAEGIPANEYYWALKRVRRLSFAERNVIATNSKYFAELIPEAVLAQMVMDT